ncbi:MAG: hypothetical protein LBH25_01795 [Fibromonadaceae bacterium]|jgi:hypothetical protein|nr:hypothetical protein [Fibromonadaceae bacterium]
MFVIEEFKLNENEETFLDIKGKEGGIFASILSLIGLRKTLELKCSNREFLFKSSSLKGQINLNIPVSAVTSIKTGFYKPYKYLVIAALAIIFAMFVKSAGSSYSYNHGGESYALLLIALAVAVVCVVVYKKSKTMLLGIYNANPLPFFNNSIEIAIKKDDELDFDTFERIAALLNNAVYELHANKK